MGFLRQRQPSGVELAELFHSIHVWWLVSVLGLSLSRFLSLFTKAQRKNDEELTYFSGLSDEAGVHLNASGGGSEQTTEHSCHISKPCALHFCFFFYIFPSLFLSMHPFLSVSHAHTHTPGASSIFSPSASACCTAFRCSWLR